MDAFMMDVDTRQVLPDKDLMGGKLSVSTVA